MIKLFYRIFLLIVFFNLIVIKQVFSEPLKKIEILGNERIRGGGRIRVCKVDCPGFIN